MSAKVIQLGKGGVHPVDFDKLSLSLRIAFSIMFLNGMMRDTAFHKEFSALTRMGYVECHGKTWNLSVRGKQLAKNVRRFQEGD